LKQNIAKHGNTPSGISNYISVMLHNSVSNQAIDFLVKHFFWWRKSSVLVIHIISSNS